jgi:glutamate transport system substrate-binding protein
MVLAGALTACGGSGTAAGALPGAGGGGAEKKLVAATPVAPASVISASPALTAIRKRGQLAVGASNDIPLYSLKDPVNGEYTGFDATLAKMLAKYIIGKPNVKWVNITSDTREALLENGTIDTAIATYQITPDRAKKVNFAGPYLMGGGGLLVRKDDTTIHGMADLAGKTVTTMPAIASEDLHKRQPKAKQVIFDSATQCLKALQQGRADAFYLNTAILDGFLTKNHDVKYAGAPIPDVPFGIGLPKDDPAMKKAVNAWLTQIETSGQWTRLWQATVGTVQKRTPPKPPKPGAVPGT